MKKALLLIVAVMGLGASALFAQTAAPQALPAQKAAAVTQTASGTQKEGGGKTFIEHIKKLKENVGFLGFAEKNPPAWVTKGYDTVEGNHVPGRDAKVVFGMPYGIGQLIMTFVCLVLLYLAIVKDFEPLLLLPIGFGGLLANMPYAGVIAPPVLGPLAHLVSEPGGFLYYFFEFGINTGLFPIMIFMGVGAMTDFGPLLANPKTALLV